MEKGGNGGERLLIVAVQNRRQQGVQVLSLGFRQARKQRGGRQPIDVLITMLKARRKARIAVAGGISSQTVKDYALLGPDVVIVGSAITHSADPAGEARKISQVLLQQH